MKLKCQLRTLNILFFSSELICQAARKTAKGSKNNWNEANIESALNICSEGKSIRATAKPCGMSEATFRNRFKIQEEGKALLGSGRKIAI